MTTTKRILWPVGTGLAGAGLLTLLYFGIVSWAESPQHAIDLFGVWGAIVGKFTALLT